MASNLLVLLVQISFSGILEVDSIRRTCSKEQGLRVQSVRSTNSSVTSSPSCLGIPFTTCNYEWQKQDTTPLWRKKVIGGGCLWIPGAESACQPNCLDSRNLLTSDECVDPKLPDPQLCQWVRTANEEENANEEESMACRYNLANEDEHMAWRGLTPRNVREHYCNPDFWTNDPNEEQPFTPINSEGQVAFCYGVSSDQSRNQDVYLPNSTHKKICPEPNSLQYLLPDPNYFIKEIDEGGSGATVWGVMCTERGKTGTCKYILKALTLKEAVVTQKALKKEAEKNMSESLLMPVCAWWIPGLPPFYGLDQDLEERFYSEFHPSISELISEYISNKSVGGRVWILMPNIAHADFLPGGASAGNPIDLKGWSATYGKKLFQRGGKNESNFEYEYTRHNMAFTEESPVPKNMMTGEYDVWARILGDALVLLATNAITDYSLLFAVSKRQPADCKSEYGWPYLLVAKWEQKKREQKSTEEWLCVATSLIDFTKEVGDDFGLGGPIGNPFDYARNMLGIFLGQRPLVDVKELEIKYGALASARKTLTLEESPEEELQSLAAEEELDSLVAIIKPE